MSSEEYQKITRIFKEAIKLEPHARPVFLAKACAGDEAVRRKVEEMLAADEEHPDFLEQPAVAAFANSIADRLQAGQIIGHYKLIKKIGGGGMGEVFEAEHINTRRKVAFKVLFAEFSENRELLHRFKQEGYATSKLEHPNIVSILDFDTIDGISFLVTQFIAGKTLRERLQDGPMSLPETLEIVRQITGALDFAHARNIVHRDIKPENIMLSRDGQDDKLTVKVLDFGLAKFTGRDSEPLDPEDKMRAQVDTQVGTIMGTPPYMSPEQIDGEAVDERTDIWSLGVVLYEMLQGGNPFLGEKPGKTRAAILERDPAPLDNLSSESNRIIGKALQKNPEERYQTISDFQSDLKNIKNNDGADTFGEWLSGSGKSFRKQLLFGVILAVIGSVAGIVMYRNYTVDINYTVGIVSLIQVVVLAFALYYFDRCKAKGLRLVAARGQDDKLNEDDRKATGYETSKDWKEASDKAKIVLRQYMRDWKGILIAWLALYAVFIFKGFVPGLDLGKLTGSTEDFYRDLLIISVSVLITGLNNISAWKIFLCFNLLNKPTEIKQEEQAVDDPAYSIGFWSVLAFSLAEIIFLGIFWAASKSNVINFDYTLPIFSGVSGIAGGIAMALYVGRLQNKFIGTGTVIGIALYSYTAIQPLFLFLEGSLYTAIALMNIALMLKCLLFLYMAWLFQSGRLLYYLVRVRRMYQNMPRDWENFQKVLKEN